MTISPVCVFRDKNGRIQCCALVLINGKLEIVETSRMTGTRPCSQCAKRRKAIEARKALLKSRGKKVQAATLGAVLAVTEAAGKIIGISGEEGEHERERREDHTGGERPGASPD